MKDLSKMTHIEDLRRVAERKVPRMFYDYVDSGSWTQTTYYNNETDFDRIKLRQKVLRNMDGRSLATTMIGQPVTMPVAIAPTGFTGMMWADGEIHAARAAEKFGIPFSLSTMSICSIEDVATHTTAPFWFQLYVMRDREFMKNLIARAKAAHCSALILTADLQVLGQRHKDIKNGLSAPPKPTLTNLLNLMTKPEWCLHMLGTRRHTFGNIVGHVKGVENMSSLGAWTSQQFDPTLSWDDVAWIKDLWGGKLIIKGILDPDDAVMAVRSGADAIVVSNHGGRQLDGAASSISMLADIVQAVQAESGTHATSCEIFLDSGVRSGQDALKAIALGAKATMIGRSFLYGLGAYGEDGVRRALEIIYNEMDISMAFGGYTNIQQVSKDILIKGTYEDLLTRPFIVRERS
ncbi:alpha-hydroxy-acid oxidizing protein [Moraxella osloensis]|nr:alpha-hydroxy acid oxidase [Moraxella osloensis]MBW4009859.1 alpha-hydroxy-acid oxidizing protein [Moraxella osloensis]